MCCGKQVVLSQGPTGATGPAGPAGPAGANGINGTNGSNGVFKYIQSFRTTFGQSNILTIGVGVGGINLSSFSNANITNTFSDFTISFWFTADGVTWTPTYLGASDGYIQFCRMISTGLTITTGNIPTGTLKVVILA